MKQLFGTLTLLALVLAPAMAFAQVKEVPGETIVKTVTIEAINYGTREITIKQDDGTYLEFTAGPEVKRFAEFKVGDKVTARYYTNIVLRVKQPGEKDVDTSTAAETKAKRPGGTIAKQRTITATITQLDPKVPSITFTGPNNWTYSSRVHDRKAIENVKVGDKVDITWTEAVLVNIAPPEKK